ncbi:MAG: DNA primase [Bacteroidia bacterium]|nr:DNA primase [Bacteroidia bacterium]
MARIPSQTVDQIYAAIDIVDVIGDYVQLKKKGANFWALSPFGNEKTPSFAVNSVKGIYKDFSSGKGGNAINFLMEMEGFTYPEALRHLAKKYNIEIQEEEVSSEQMQARNKRESLFVLNEFAARWFHEQLTATEDGKEIGLSYFKERGLLDQTVKDFQLGYSPDDWEVFSKAAQAAQYNPEYITELGLASKSEKTGRLIDRFRGRVMFPIANPMGKVIGFGGRILGNRKDVGKYINSPESPVYHKSQVLYALSLAKKAIRDEDLCILTEGYMDVILMHQNGFKNVVASSGTALTTEQVRLIRRYTRNVLMIYDGDPAGIKAASRGIDILVKEEMNPQVLILPDKHDPDSYVRAHGASGLKKFIKENAKDFVDFKMWVLALDKDKSDPKIQAEIIRGVAETLAKLPDLIQRQMYIRKVSQEVDITEALMTHAVDEARREIGKLEQRDRKREEARAAREEPTEVKVKPLQAHDTLEMANQEKEILRIMVNHYDKSIPESDGPLEDEQGKPIEYEQMFLMDYMLDELEGLSFENQTFENLKNSLLNEFDEKESVNIHPYLNHEDPAITSLVSGLLTVPETSPKWSTIRADIFYDGDVKMAAREAVYHYKSKKLGKLLQQCSDQLREAERSGKHEEADQLLEKYMVLKEMSTQVQKTLGTEGALKAGDGRL